jgi:hypothetical protein
VYVKPKILNLVFHASPLRMQHLGVRSKTGWLGFCPREAFVLAGLMSVGLLSCSLVGFDVYQLLAHGRWFSPGTPASSITKTGCHDIAEILLKVALEYQKSIKSSTK